MDVTRRHMLRGVFILSAGALLSACQSPSQSSPGSTPSTQVVPSPPGSTRTPATGRPATPQSTAMVGAIPLGALRTPQPITTVRLDPVPIVGTPAIGTGNAAFGRLSAIPDSPTIAQIGQAFWAYWRTLTQGEAHLDGTQYATVMAGDELVRAQRDLAQLQSDGRGRRYFYDEQKLLLFYQEGDLAGCIFTFSGWVLRLTPQEPSPTTVFTTGAYNSETIYTLARGSDDWKVTSDQPSGR